MSYIALNTAATGMTACSTSLDLIANNLANASTTGFKSSRANFEDLYYQELAQPGLPAGDATQRPTGLYVGLGTQISGTQLDFAQGPAEPTGKPYDIMIEGDGFFQLQVPESLGDGIGYTRAGNFTLNENGQMVLANSAGYLLEPPITIPENALTVSIAQNGVVTASIPGQTDPVDCGTILLARFVNPAGLASVGNNTYIQTEASGEPLELQPNEDGAGALLQSSLEASNVDPVTELVSLIKTQRNFEMNSQVIQAANETLQNITNLAIR